MSHSGEGREGVSRTRDVPRKYRGLFGRTARRRCPHAQLVGIYGDLINHVGGWRLFCIDCRRYLDGPVSIAATRPAAPSSGDICGATTSVLGVAHVCALPRGHATHKNADDTAHWPWDDRPGVPIGEVLARMEGEPS